MIWPKTTVVLQLIKNNSRCLFKRQQEHDKIRNCHHKSASQVEPLKISSKFCYIVSLIDYQASVWLSVCVSVSPFVSLSFSFSVSLLLLVSLSQSVSLNLSLSLSLSLSVGLLVSHSVCLSLSLYLSVCLCLSLSQFLAVT